MKAYRIVTYVLDFYNKLSPEEIAEELTYNRHLNISTGAIDEIDIGEWDDDHPLNYINTDVEAYFQERLNESNRSD